MASVLDLIGDTPLVEVTRIDCGLCRLFLKLESANPSGSLKDRPARAMIEAAEADGRLKPGGTIVEATAGNTGLGLALVGGRKGYRTVLVVPDKMAREKVLHAQAMGAEVVTTRSDVGKGHPDYYQDLAEAIARRTPGAIFINQFANPANPRAHETTTGPEILRQMDGDVDAVVVGVGSGGMLTGIGRFMRAASPKTMMILADPEGSVLAPLVETGKMGEVGSWAVEGIGEDFIPPNADLSLVKKAYSIPDPESFAASRELLRAEGILAGSSSGTLLAAALRYCRAQTTPKRVVSLVCDSGAKYLSKVFNPSFLAQEGWTHPDRHGTVRDVVINRYSEGTAVVVRPDDTLRTVFSRMRSTDVSQLPVIDDGGHVVGLVDESDVLAALLTDAERRRRGVRAAGEGRHGDAARDHLGRRADRRSGAAVPQGLHRHRHGRRPVRRRGDPPRPHQLFPDHAVMSRIPDQLALRDPLRACRAGARPDHRRGDDADLRHLDLRAAEPGREQGLRLCAHQEPDPHGVRALRRRSRRRQRGFAFASGLAAIATTLECLDQGSHIVAVDDLYGGSRRLFERVRTRSAGSGGELCRPHRRRGARGRDPAEHAADLDRDADQSAAEADRSRTRRRHRASARRFWRSPTTPSPAPMCSVRSSMASIWSCIRPRNISTAIPTWSAASRWSATTPSCASG